MEKVRVGTAEGGGNRKEGFEDKRRTESGEEELEVGFRCGSGDSERGRDSTSLPHPEERTAGEPDQNVPFHFPLNSLQHVLPSFCSLSDVQILLPHSLGTPRSPQLPSFPMGSLNGPR